MIAILTSLALSLTATLAPAVQDPGADEVPPIQDLGDTYLLSFSENNDGLTLERWVSSANRQLESTSHTATTRWAT